MEVGENGGSTGAPGMLAETEPASPTAAEEVFDDRDVEATEEYHEVDVFYATDRRPTGLSSPAAFYGGKRNLVPVTGSPMQYGLAKVTIPKTHRLGSLESPKWYRLEFWEDPRKHVMIGTMSSMDGPTFFESVSGAADGAPENQALIFVHGFNVKFADAVRRTGQIAYDLNFPGVAMTFSWPSEGYPNFTSYNSDQNDADWAQLHLAQLLVDLQLKTEVEKIHIIAHSMGGRVLTGALELAAREGFDLKLNNVILAAPDVDADVFTQQIMPKIQGTSERFTMYASSRDQALAISQQFNGNMRLGLTGPSLVVLPGMDTVDVSNVDMSLLGHGYFGEHKLVIDDMLRMLLRNQSAEERGLVSGARGEWLLR